MVQTKVLKHMVKCGVASQKSEGFTRAVVWGLCDLDECSSYASTEVSRWAHRKCQCYTRMLEDSQES